MTYTTSRPSRLSLATCKAIARWAAGLGELPKAAQREIVNLAISCQAPDPTPLFNDQAEWERRLFLHDKEATNILRAVFLRPSIEKNMPSWYFPQGGGLSGSMEALRRWKARDEAIVAEAKERRACVKKKPQLRRIK